MAPLSTVGALASALGVGGDDQNQKKTKIAVSTRPPMNQPWSAVVSGHRASSVSGIPSNTTLTSVSSLSGISSQQLVSADASNVTTGLCRPSAASSPASPLLLLQHASSPSGPVPLPKDSNSRSLSQFSSAAPRFGLGRQMMNGIAGSTSTSGGGRRESDLSLAPPPAATGIPPPVSNKHLTQQTYQSATRPMILRSRKNEDLEHNINGSVDPPFGVPFQRHMWGSNDPHFSKTDINTTSSGHPSLGNSNDLVAQQTKSQLSPAVGISYPSHYVEDQHLRQSRHATTQLYTTPASQQQQFAPATMGYTIGHAMAPSVGQGTMAVQSKQIAETQVACVHSSAGLAPLTENDHRQKHNAAIEYGFSKSWADATDHEESDGGTVNTSSSNSTITTLMTYGDGRLRSGVGSDSDRSLPVVTGPCSSETSLLKSDLKQPGDVNTRNWDDEDHHKGPSTPLQQQQQQHPKKFYENPSYRCQTGDHGRRTSRDYPQQQQQIRQQLHGSYGRRPIRGNQSHQQEQSVYHHQRSGYSSSSLDASRSHQRPWQSQAMDTANYQREKDQQHDKFSAIPPSLMQGDKGSMAVLQSNTESLYRHQQSQQQQSNPNSHKYQKSWPEVGLDSHNLREVAELRGKTVLPAMDEHRAQRHESNGNHPTTMVRTGNPVSTLNESQQPSKIATHQQQQQGYAPKGYATTTTSYGSSSAATTAAAIFPNYSPRGSNEVTAPPPATTVTAPYAYPDYGQRMYPPSWPRQGYPVADLSVYQTSTTGYPDIVPPNTYQTGAGTTSFGESGARNQGQQQTYICQATAGGTPQVVPLSALASHPYPLGRQEVVTSGERIQSESSIQRGVSTGIYSYGPQVDDNSQWSYQPTQPGYYYFYQQPPGTYAVDERGYSRFAYDGPATTTQGIQVTPPGTTSATSSSTSYEITTIANRTESQLPPQQQPRTVTSYPKSHRPSRSRSNEVEEPHWEEASKHQLPEHRSTSVDPRQSQLTNEPSDTTKKRNMFKSQHELEYEKKSLYDQRSASKGKQMEDYRGSINYLSREGYSSLEQKRSNEREESYEEKRFNENQRNQRGSSERQVPVTSSEQRNYTGPPTTAVQKGGHFVETNEMRRGPVLHSSAVLNGSLGSYDSRKVRYVEAVWHTIGRPNSHLEPARESTTAEPRRPTRSQKEVSQAKVSDIAPTRENKAPTEGQLAGELSEKQPKLQQVPRRNNPCRQTSDSNTAASNAVPKQQSEYPSDKFSTCQNQPPLLRSRYQEKSVCRHFLLGRCIYEECKFLHPSDRAPLIRQDCRAKENQPVEQIPQKIVQEGPQKGKTKEEHTTKITDGVANSGRASKAQVDKAIPLSQIETKDILGLQEPTGASLSPNKKTVKVPLKASLELSSKVIPKLPSNSVTTDPPKAVKKSKEQVCSQHRVKQDSQQDLNVEVKNNRQEYRSENYYKRSYNRGVAPQYRETYIQYSRPQRQQYQRSKQNQQGTTTATQQQNQHSVAMPQANEEDQRPKKVDNEVEVSESKEHYQAKQQVLVQKKQQSASRPTTPIVTKQAPQKVRQSQQKSIASGGTSVANLPGHQKNTLSTTAVSETTLNQNSGEPIKTKKKKPKKKKSCSNAVEATKNNILVASTETPTILKHVDGTGGATAKAESTSTAEATAESSPSGGKVDAYSSSENFHSTTAMKSSSTPFEARHGTTLFVEDKAAMGRLAKTTIEGALKNSRGPSSPHFQTTPVSMTASASPEVVQSTPHTAIPSSKAEETKPDPVATTTRSTGRSNTFVHKGDRRRHFHVRKLQDSENDKLKVGGSTAGKQKITYRGTFEYPEQVQDKADITQERRYSSHEVQQKGSANSLYHPQFLRPYTRGRSRARRGGCRRGNFYQLEAS